MEKLPTSVPAGQDDAEFVNRKLIRPTIQRTDGATGAAAAAAPAPVKDNHVRRERPTIRRAHAPEQTHAETFYFQKQVAAQTLMNVVLTNGEHVQGVITWYDRNCLRLQRNGKPNLLIYKSGIRYMYKAEE